jgi:hypothetical protein
MEFGNVGPAKLFISYVKHPLGVAVIENRVEGFKITLGVSRRARVEWYLKYFYRNFAANRVLRRSESSFRFFRSLGHDARPLRCAH